MNEGEVYKKKEVHGKKWGKTQVPRYKEEMRRTLRENRVNSNISYVNVASLGQFGLRKWFTHLIRSVFSSLFFSSGRVSL